MALTEYNKKRSFKKTPEPKGLVKKNRGAPLMFVVQKHDASRLHYDLRLEIQGVLKSWAVPKGPSLNPADKRLAMMTEDHPMSYATFEGEIPAGEYGAGDVIVWDMGVCAAPATADAKESEKKLSAGLNKGELKFVLYGEKLKGGFVLVRMKERGENAWLLIKERDAYAADTDVTLETESVISRRTLPRDTASTKKVVPKKSKPTRTPQKTRNNTTKKDPMPHHVRPMLAQLIDEPFDKKDWLFEVKWDGYRAIAEIERGAVRLYSRNQKSFAQAYPSLVEALKKIPHDCVLDGEIVALKNGRTDFHALQRYQEEPVPLQYVVFDCLYLDGQDLQAMPLRTRREYLRSILPESKDMAFSSDIETSGNKFFAQIRAQGLEGMVAKNATSTYQEGVRGGEWLKVKNIQEQEAVIVGFTKPKGSRKSFGALVLAAYDNGVLTYIGHSGGGFTESELKELHQKLLKIKTSKILIKAPKDIGNDITWVKPTYVCEIAFTEWTPSGQMRHPIYKGIRNDKTPKEVVREQVQKPAQTKTRKNAVVRGELKLTNTDKVYWPEEGYTKGDLIAYYESVADTLLPYLKDRPQNLNRHPNGITGQNFFQKNFTTALPSFIETIRIWSESNNDYRNYIVCQNKETLLYMVNLGCIELNPWNSRIGTLENPDYMILDLDPNGRPFDDLIKVARVVKDVLDMACEEHYPKTSGKSGIHVVIPLGARYTYDECRQFAELLMRLVHARVPELTSLERNPGKRGGKIYLDYLQNRFGQTLACAYSVRPYPGATVSAPLEWSEVRKGLTPAAFTIKTIHKRLQKKGDLWKPVFDRGVDLRDALRCLQEHM